MVGMGVIMAPGMHKVEQSYQANLCYFVRQHSPQAMQSLCYNSTTKYTDMLFKQHYTVCMFWQHRTTFVDPVMEDYQVSTNLLIRENVKENYRLYNAGHCLCFLDHQTLPTLLKWVKINERLGVKKNILWK